jgi:HEAT repeat protein
MLQPFLGKFWQPGRLKQLGPCWKVRSSVGILLLVGLCLGTSGCKAAWPWGGKVSDSVPGITPPRERIAELRKMGKQAASASPEQREQIAAQVAAAYPREPDPLVRLEMVRTLGACPGPTAEATLREAAKDKDADVRVAVCRALGKQPGTTASEVLRERLASDSDIDVRLAAAEALGSIRDPSSVAALGTALEDRDPAMQYQAVKSLRRVAPVDLGNDVDRWRQYVKDGSIAPAKPFSLAEAIRNLF